MPEPAELPPAPPAGVTAAPPAPAASPAADAAPYRPLSGLALGGLALAGAYALLVAVGGVVGFSTRQPWLLPGWTFLLPCLALVCSLVARARVRGSEGALSGLALTSWGVGLSAVVGLSYGAYYTATYVAVRQQAKAFADAWLAELKRGEVEKAFWMATPPPRPAESARTRADLEVRYNASPPQRPDASGPFTNFAQNDYVRLLGQAGDRAEVTFVGVRDLVYEEGGYRVRLAYEVSTPMGRFTLVVTVQGLESPRREWQGRQWTVLLRLTDRDAEPGAAQQVELKDEGKAVTEMGQAASFRTREWSQLLAPDPPRLTALAELSEEQRQADARDRYEKAFLMTRPAAERGALARGRERLALAGLALGPAAALAAAAAEEAPDAALRRYAVARRDFALGGLIKADAPAFWAADEQRAGIVREARLLFSNAPRPLPPGIMPAVTPFPDARFDGRVWRVRCDARLGLPRADALPYTVDAMVVLVQEDPDDPSPRSWRIEAVELIRGRVLPPPAEGGPRQ